MAGTPTDHNRLCAVCGSYVHHSNKRVQCRLCNSFIHRGCLSTNDNTIFCNACLSESLPFVSLNDFEFLNEIGRATSVLESNIFKNCSMKLNLNPFDNLDDKFINNEDIDADKNFYGIDSHVINDYLDSSQLDKILDHGQNTNS